MIPSLDHIRAWLAVATRTYWRRVALYSAVLIAVYWVIDRVLPPSSTPVLGVLSLLSMSPMVAAWSSRTTSQYLKMRWYATAVAIVLILGGLAFHNTEALTRAIMPGLLALVGWGTLLTYWYLKPRKLALHHDDRVYPLAAKGHRCPGCRRLHWALFSAADPIVFGLGEEKFAVDGVRPRKGVVSIALGTQVDGRSFCPPVSHLRGLSTSAWVPSYLYVTLP